MAELISSFMTFFSSLVAWRDLILFFAVFGTLEHVAPMVVGQKILRKGFGTDLAYIVLGSLFYRAIISLIFPMLVRGLEMYIPMSLPSMIGEMPFVLQICGVVLIGDFGIYTMHRLMHRIPWLWPFHAIHHSSEQLDWLSTFRVHPIDQLFIRGLSLVPAFLMGFSTSAIAIAIMIYEWQSLMVHANVKLNIGPLRWIFVTPEFHHWHHANEPSVYDRNFSSQLVIWDLLFGTANMHHSHPQHYGANKAIPSDYVGQFFYPFRKLLETLRR